MSQEVDRLKDFVQYAQTLSGDEKGEAQVFCDRLFRAFGHGGYKEAGATLEWRVKKGDTTAFADLLWPGRLLLEMKKSGTNLNLHFQQAFDYWIHTVPHRPRYVVLCNFDEFWVYDFDVQLDAPMDVVQLTELPKRHLALNFLFPSNPKPQFGNDLVAVSREAASYVADVFQHLAARLGGGHKADPSTDGREQAQRFILQTVVAMFAEDMDLLPAGITSSLINECLDEDKSSYDLLGGLFRQMNSPIPASAGRFKGVPYFNGGLFSTIAPLELEREELIMLGLAANTDWSQVNPAIFGTLFQYSMGAAKRHALGAHFTSEADIQRVVGPTILQPWRDRIDNASSMKQLLALRHDLLSYRILDPACGSGNFLYVAFRSLVRVEMALLQKLKDTISAKEFRARVKTLSLISPRQFYGIDCDAFAVELAKVTLMLAKKLALDEAISTMELGQIDLDLHQDHALPLDNLDANFQAADALFVDWPSVDAIVSNPPYQSKNKMQVEYGRAYLNRLREKYPEIPGRGDYCVYWFRRAHDHLADGQRAGMVGTNTIRQNYSREGGLDYVVGNGGTIIDAVSSQVWSGDAVVHVSIVNWVKGESDGLKRLSRQVGDKRDAPWETKQVERIDAALSWSGVDTTKVSPLAAAARVGGCFQGQTHGHEGFLLPRDEAERLLGLHPEFASVLHPYLTADEFLGRSDGLPTRYVIDFAGLDVIRAKANGQLFERVRMMVLPDRQKAAAEEEDRNRAVLAANTRATVNRHHANFLASWWQLSYPRAGMLAVIETLPRYIVCGRVTKRPVFAFVSSGIRPSDALMVFPYADDYSYGILQSGQHWAWFTGRCSTLKADFRYTSNTVFDTFAWPQSPAQRDVAKVAAAAADLRQVRHEQHTFLGVPLRELYRTLELPGRNPLRDAHEALDEAVRVAYGFGASEDPLLALLALNTELATAEAAGGTIVGPGLPPTITDRTAFRTRDCIRMP